MTATPGRRHAWGDVVGLIAILVLAALARLPGLVTRGQWDADQGNHLLVLLRLVRDGQVPLLGPSTFAGTFHHGALYYYLLGPAALVSDVDPGVVTLEIAVLGIVTVAVVWALGRAVGGPWVGHVAGLLAAVSPSFVLGSTFIWNPNLVPLGSAIALLGLVQAWRTTDPRWWLLAATGAMIAMQLHVSGAVLAVPLGIGFLLDVRRRRPGRGSSRRTWVLIGVGCAAIVALGYLPLVIYELGHGFPETRGLLGYLASGGSGGGDLVGRSLIVALRSIAWPFVGVVTEAPLAASVVTVVVVLLWVAGYRFATAAERPLLRFLAAIVAWSVPVLALTAPSLSVSIPGLPNDHYHTFLDPLVIVAAAAGAAAIARWGVGAAAAPGLVAKAAAVTIIVGLASLAVVRWPPAAAPDGGWPLVDDAAARVLETAKNVPIGLDGIPPFKSADALRFPLERRGALVLADGTEPAPGEGLMVLVCDPFFNDLVGASCGGPAEDAWLAGPGRGSWDLVDRFEAGPRRVISVYAGATGG